MSGEPTGLKKSAELKEPAGFKTIAQKRERGNDLIDRAMDLVRAFIIEKDLILYGGLAIDYALRLRGSSIYPEDERPDYDFFSKDSVKDAYDLADILEKSGFRNVSAIRRLHVQTMGVRVDFADVADISHVPSDVYDSFPTLRWNGMRVLHPDYQRSDMHLSFSYPFTGPPRENIFNRFKKDLERYNLIAEKWPLSAETFHGGDESAAHRTTRGGRNEITLPKDIPYAIHGEKAYGLLLKALRELTSRAGPRYAKRVADAKLGEPDPSAPLIFATPEPVEFVDMLIKLNAGTNSALDSQVKPTWREPYMDSQPATCEVTLLGQKVIVFSTKFRLLAVSVIDAGSPPIVSPQYLMLHYLHNANSASARRDANIRRYIDILGILDIADELLAAAREPLTKEAGGTSKGLSDFYRLVNTSPFALTSRTIGTTNYDMALQIKVAQNAEMMKIEAPEGFPTLEGLPQNYYPARAKSQPEVSYESVFFRRSGRVVEDPRPGKNILL